MLGRARALSFKLAVDVICHFLNVVYPRLSQVAWQFQWDRNSRCFPIAPV